MIETRSKLVDKFLMNKITQVLVYADAAYIGDEGQLIISVLGEGRRHQIDWNVEGSNWEEFDCMRAVITAI